MKELMKKIAEAQIKYHITGGQVEETYESTHETKAGTTITYTANRDWSERGLSYIVRKKEVSISRGYKETYLGYTHGMGRETVIFHKAIN